MKNLLSSLKSKLTSKKSTPAIVPAIAAPIVFPEGKRIRVRFSENDDGWVEVGSGKQNSDVIRVLPVPSYLSDVRFSVEVNTRGSGCGSYKHYAGICEGIFTEDRPPSCPITGMDNLSFTQDGFHVMGDTLKRVNFLMLSEDRFAKVSV